MNRLWTIAPALLLAVGCGGSVEAFPGAGLEGTVLEQAVEDCDLTRMGTVAHVADEGRTLILDGKGTDTSFGVPVEKIACVLFELDAPESVLAHMDSTSAMQGRQSNSWDDIDAAWSYHPDSGMDLVLESTD